MERIESFLDGLPGYEGYRDKESRRDSDRRMRESIANQLESIALRVERGGAKLVAERKLDAAATVERLVKALNHAANLVRTQSYGYGGIFTDMPVDERALNQLFLFDKGLGVKVSQLDHDLSGIEAAIAGGEDVPATVQKAEIAVQAIVDQLSARSAVVETAAPAAARTLFTPVDDAQKEPPPPPIEIRLGDAIAWFDEDYLVDATIDITDAVHRVRFFHIGVDPDAWLVIADRDEQLIALVKDSGEVGGGEVVAWTLTGTGRTNQAGGDTIKANAYVTCYVDGDNDVAFRLLSGTDERYLKGTRVHPDDLSIYGKPAKN